MADTNPARNSQSVDSSVVISWVKVWCTSRTLLWRLRGGAVSKENETVEKVEVEADA
jgi:hypothetical protein